MRCSDQSLKIQRCRTTGERPPRIICPHLSVRWERLQFVKAGWPAILCLEPTVPPELPPYYCAAAQRPATYQLRSRLGFVGHQRRTIIPALSSGFDPVVAGLVDSQHRSDHYGNVLFTTTGKVSGLGFLILWQYNSPRVLVGMTSSHLPGPACVKNVRAALNVPLLPEPLFL